MRAKNLWLAMTLSMASPAAAQPVAPAPTVTASIERHHTSNALDSDLAMADWYTLIRGSLQHAWQIEDGVVRLGVEAQASRYDTVRIEDDRAAAVLLEATRKLGASVELRGALSYRYSSEGDDLAIGPFVLGMRTPKHVFGAETQLGFDLGGGTALVFELADAYEKVGRTRFQDDLLLPAKLDPDRNRLRFGARLTRTSGQVAHAVAATANLVSVDRLGAPPVGLSLGEYTLRAEAAWKGADGSSLGAAIGLQMLRGAQRIYQDIRPTWQAGFVKMLPHGLELRGTTFGRFETTDSDDPLASWLQRGEIEARLRCGEKLTLGTGVFAELKENLLLENKERAHGLYAEAIYDATRHLSLVVRLDYTNRYLTVFDMRKKAFDAFVGIRTKI
ncbi:hypothetical protein C7441_107113 [Pseudaminobacter salicylatoxidans]|uniref:Porin n=1 Tax=Pseudaminobacter salicylatoxidans TaxID=93369 RepID=A0A316C3W0_PSESE|nr:hypothetical protein [Pseudaminobacter salicylatoxidans]PWJ83953.1 hypothetical protein C7441_107113 [Pseudaminobacter salicylatoxidans]